MPKALERKLRRQATQKGLRGRRRDAYVYGTLRRSGWTPKKRKHRGKRNR